MSASNYTEDNVINTTLRGAAMPVPSNIYVALFTADPTDSNVTTNEVQTSGWPSYERMDAANGGTIDSGWTAPADGVSSNAKTIEYAANNGTAAINVTHAGLYDAITGGNLLYHTALENPKNIEVGDVLAFAIGAIVATAT